MIECFGRVAPNAGGLALAGMLAFAWQRPAFTQTPAQQRMDDAHPAGARVDNRATAAEIKDAAVAGGMRTLREDGVAKVLAGVTTTSEVERVTMRPEGEEAGRDSITGVSPVSGTAEVE